MLNCCYADALEAKISEELRRTSGTDGEEQCRVSVSRCLNVMGKTYSEKGNDTNAEAERQLRSCAAISLKRPFKTVKTFISDRLQFLRTFRYVHLMIY